jgi:hypothetical protein
MTYLEHLGVHPWENYHRTLGPQPLDTWGFTSGNPADAAAYFAATTTELRYLLGAVAADGSGLRPVGACWSFSDILNGGATLLQTHDKDRVYAVVPGQLDPAAPAGRYLLASAGTTLHNLNRLIEPRSSLITSGAHDGQTLGGLLGTGTHGSVVGHAGADGSVTGYGAFQNQVRGIQLVTGPQSSVWIEPGPQPILLRSFAESFAGTVRLEADSFEAALVHLGGLGLVNAVLLEVVEGYMLDVVHRKVPLDLAALQLVERGEFRAFAERVWPATDRDPYYVEIILDPYHPFEGYDGAARNALITLLFKIPSVEPFIDDPNPVADDVLNLLSRGVRRAPELNLIEPGEFVFDIVEDQFPETPDGTEPERKTWGQFNGLHEKIKVMDREVDLFNAAYALDRGELLRALPVMLDAFNQSCYGPLVFTLRFVTNASGLLAFTRFPETVVINLDGLRLFGWAKAAARRVAFALEHHRIPFSQHWGKQGVITRRRVECGFGDPADPCTRAGRWRCVRHSLLDSEMRSVLTNKAIEEWGLA